MPQLPDQRRLIIMRHAKSSHDTDAPSDHARPLNKRGRQDAPRVANELAKLNWAPDFIISSDSLRTRQTLEGLNDGFPTEVPHELAAPLYAGGYQELLAISGIIPASSETALVLGHNPGCEEIVEQLTGQAVILKTAACALMELPQSCTWPEALRQRGAWRLVDVIYPREI